MAGTIFWDDTLSERLAGLWKTHTASEIATIFAADGYQVTRNSIVGRVHRMGLSGTRKDFVSQNTPRHIEPQRPKITRNNEDIGRSGQAVQAINRARRKKSDRPATKPETFTPHVCDVVSMRKTIVQLGLYGLECRWADDERNGDGLHTFCGHPANGHPFCAAHRNLAIDHSRMARIKGSARKVEMVAA